MWVASLACQSRDSELAAAYLRALLVFVLVFIETGAMTTWGCGEEPPADSADRLRTQQLHE